MNIKTAYACALASKLAYETTDIVAVGSVAFTVVPMDGGPTIFAFRGTIQCFDDFADDGDIKPDDDPIFGMLHGGFNYGSADYTAAVLAKVTGDYLLTGHSLGGARALIAGARAAYANRPPVGICTFGAPRPGGSKLVDYLNRVAAIDALEFARNGDPIPNMVEPYKHPYSLHMIGDAVQFSMNLFVNHQIARYCDDLAGLAG